MKPLARWNPARSVWETNETLICGHSDVWSETFPSSGTWADGLVYALPTSAHPTDGSGSSSSPGLLPTPRTTDGNGAGAHGTGGMDLRTAATLLPTPMARDWKGAGPADLDRNDPSLSAIPMLLPTPTATPYGNNQSPSPGAAVRPSLDSLAPTLLPTPTTTQRGPDANRDIRVDAGPNLHNSVLRLHGDRTQPPSDAGSD